MTRQESQLREMCDHSASDQFHTVHVHTTLIPDRSYSVLHFGLLINYEYFRNLSRWLVVENGMKQ